MLDLPVGSSVLPLALLLRSCGSKTNPSLLSTDPIPCDKPGNRISNLFWVFVNWQLTQKRVTGRDPGCALESVKQWGFEGQGPVCHLLYWDTVGSRLEIGVRCDSHTPQKVERFAFLLLGAALDKSSLLGSGNMLVRPAILAVLGCQNCTSLLH